MGVQYKTINHAHMNYILLSKITNFGYYFHKNHVHYFQSLPISNFELLFLISYCLLLLVVVLQAIRYTQNLNNDNFTRNDNNVNNLQIQIYDFRRNSGVNRRNRFLPYDENSPVAKWRASLRNKSTLKSRRELGDSSSDDKYFSD